MNVLWILLIPFIWLLSAKYLLRLTFSWKELGISFVVITILTTVTWQLGKYGQTADTEVWNGQITAKKRVHDSYVRSYSCNCYTTCSGSGQSRSCTEHCSTCYEDHYTVEWFANSTIGKFRFKYRDTTSKSVYNEPDPARYTKCKVGEPASREMGYTNYVQAVPESLFHDDSKVAQQFPGKVPAYPRVYDHYRINRVLNVDSKIPAATVKQFNTMLSNELKTIGAAKQANIILILTEIDDASYRYAVENAWLGGEKNDIIIFAGLDGDKITWVDIMTWALNSGNELFHVKMRDGIKAQKTLSPHTFTPFVAETVMKYYDRPQMKDYEYLADDIDPPTWVIVLALIFAFGGSALLTFLFHKHEL